MLNKVFIKVDFPIPVSPEKESIISTPKVSPVSDSGTRFHHITLSYHIIVESWIVSFGSKDAGLDSLNLQVSKLNLIKYSDTFGVI